MPPIPPWLRAPCSLSLRLKIITVDKTFCNCRYFLFLISDIIIEYVEIRQFICVVRAVNILGN